MLKNDWFRTLSAVFIEFTVFSWFPHEVLDCGQTEMEWQTIGNKEIAGRG